MQSKIVYQIISVILSVSLMFQMSMPMVYAAENNSLQATKTITDFAALAEDVKTITVPIGTTEEELPLPETLTATVVSTVYEETTADSGSTEGTQLVEKKVTEDVELAVTWESDKPFSSEMADTFTYTAKLTDGSYTLTEGAELPTVKVTVSDGSVMLLADSKAATYNINTGALTINSSNLSTYNNATITGNTSSDSEQLTIDGKVTLNLTIKDLSIAMTGYKGNMSGITLKNGATLNLTVEGTNTLTGAYGGAGIDVPQGCTLNITAGSTGTLTATGGNGYGGGAGIGAVGNKWSPNDTTTETQSVGTIHIAGGTIIATGGTAYAYNKPALGAAGIGGSCKSTTGVISISGGTITATGGHSSAGIGGGQSGCVESITIQGGTVTATGGTSGSAIGSGFNGIADYITCGTIELSGGVVAAKGNIGYGGTALSGYNAGGTVSIGSGAAVTIKDGVISPAAAGINTYPLSITIYDGRLTNTIAKASFTINGRTYQESINVTENYVGTLSCTLVVNGTLAGEQTATLSGSGYSWEDITCSQGAGGYSAEIGKRLYPVYLWFYDPAITSNIAEATVSAQRNSISLNANSTAGIVQLVCDGTIVKQREGTGKMTAWMPAGAGTDLSVTTNSLNNGTAMSQSAQTVKASADGTTIIMHDIGMTEQISGPLDLSYGSITFADNGGKLAITYTPTSGGSAATVTGQYYQNEYEIIQTDSNSTPTTNQIIFQSTLDFVKVKLNGVNMASQGKAIDLQTAKAQLNLSGTNTIDCGKGNSSSPGRSYIGIHAGEGSALTIDGSGSLEVKNPSYNGVGIGGYFDGTKEGAGTIRIQGGALTVSGRYGAAIGSSTQYVGSNPGDIYISGGTVNASIIYVQGGEGAAAIGGSTNAAPASVHISGGNVTATSRDYGAGIGSGDSGAIGGGIEISGGEVTAKTRDKSDSGAIGGGTRGVCPAITISGGTIKATGKASVGTSSSGSGGSLVITGGSIRTVEGGQPKINLTAKNGTAADSVPVYYTTADVSGIYGTNAAVTDASIAGASYGFNDVKTDANGVLHLYLPASAEGTKSEASFKDACYSGAITSTESSNNLKRTIPLKVKADSVTTAGAVLNVTANSGSILFYVASNTPLATGSEVENTNGVQSVVLTNPAQAVTISNLNANTTYTYYLIAKNGSTYSDVVPVTFTTSSPLAPTVTGVTVDPAAVSVQKGTTQQFSATVTGTNHPAQTVTWSVNGGKAGTSISAGGLLTIAADETAASLTVTATSTVDTNKTGTATVTVTTPQPPAPTVTAVTVDPATVSVQKGTTQQFTASVTGTNSPAQTVTWNVSGGGAETSISAGGLLTIAADETAASLTVTATSTVDTNQKGTATVTVTTAQPPAPTVTSVTVEPATASVQKGKTQQFTASVTGTNNPAQTVSWSVSGGKEGTSISVGGLLTIAADETAAELTVTATSTVDTNQKGTAAVTVTTPQPPAPTVTNVTVGPASASVDKGKTQQFSASVTGTNNPAQTVTWNVSGDKEGTSISAGGLLTIAADETAASLTVTATSTVDTNKKGTATVTVTTPQPPAPTVTAVTVDPATASVQKGKTQQFTASVTGTNSPAQTVTWNVSGGKEGTSISAGGLLTIAADETAASLTVTATSTVDTSKNGTATVTVTTTEPPAPTVTAVTVDPATVSVQKGTTQQFAATVTGTNNPAQSVTWDMNGGGAGTSISAGGLLTIAADETAASLTVTATSTVDTSKNGTATVTVTTAEPPAPTVTDVTVDPATVSVQKGTTQQFAATVTGTNNPAQTVTWSVNGGGAGTSISTGGLLTIAADETATELTVTATSTVDISKKGTATVTATGGSPSDPKKLVIEAEFTGGPYNGKPYAYTGTPSFKNGTDAVTGITYTATYAGRDGTAYAESATAPTHAGQYNLMLTVSGESAKTYDGTTALGFAITKKPVTAKPNDVSIESNASFPAFTWSIATGIAGETITAANDASVVMGAQENGTKLNAVKVGTFDIVFTTAPVFNPSGDIEKNYAIQIDQGKLTVTKHNPGGGSSGGGGSSSSTVKADSSITVTTPPVTTDNPNPPMRAAITVTSTVAGGTVNVTVSASTVADAISQAQAEARKNGTEKNGVVVEIKADTPNSTASSLSANLPKATMDALVKAGVIEVRINSGAATISLNLETLKTIQKEIGADVNVSVKKVDNSTLSAAAKAIVGNRPVFDLSITGANGTRVTNFGQGQVSVSIPYTLGANETAGNVKAYYIDNEGQVQEMTNCVYDEKSQTLTFVTDHFSKFAVGYKEATTTAVTKAVFTDIANHWAKQAIEFVTAQGLFSGTGDGKFSPDMAMTRGMFVTTMGKLAKADASSYTASSFADVKAGAYYLPYIEWANQSGIVNGVSEASFAPDQSITREQMAVIIASYARTTGLELPQVHAPNPFADNAQIGSWAKDAVLKMQMAGIISGKSNNMFDPQGTATRAEVSAVLKCLAEAVARQ